ncbi:MAG: cytochrome c oxidase assembly protein [Actinomycetota bacterium]|nr:cytochrome c oxidase assembly protein [Actinomycetota bacterium]
MSELLLVVAVALAALAYWCGLQRLWDRAGPGRVTRTWQAACFAAGLATLLVAATGPLDHLAAERLWGHMVQHVLLLAVAAPLLVLGNPLPTLLWALPARRREQAAAVSRRVAHTHATAAGWSMFVAGALAVQSVALWAWHAPGPYQAALASDWVHGLEHFSFLGAALLFWWAVAGARRRSLYGPGVVAVFLVALQGTLLGVFMTLARSPWYPTYAVPARSGQTPLEDQQLAGVIMWGPGGALYLLAAVMLFAAWLGGQGGHGEKARAETGVLVRGAPVGR